MSGGEEGIISGTDSDEPWEPDALLLQSLLEMGISENAAKRVNIS